MMKYTDSKIVFQEVPNEITLAINISNCPCQCEGCHSPYLAEDVGVELDEHKLLTLINKNRGITCVAFMGGDANPGFINKLAKLAKTGFNNIKVCWYSGRQDISENIDISNFDYIKVGPYKEKLGPLDSKTTNQKFYKVYNNKLEDITNKFWKHEIKD